jgi:hypothetical protein
MAKDAAPSREDCNSLCARCVRHCRQPAAVRLLECPRFRPFPFRIEKNRFEQLDLFDSTLPEKD